jgi:hypothetical protein
VKELTEIVSQSDEKRTTIVYQLLDNYSFYAKKEDGRRELPVRGANGKFHINGKLEITTREDVKRMVSSAIPLLRAGGQCRKLILTPGCRYRYNPCCLTKGHCANIRERNYGKWMEEKLAEVRGIVRDYVRMRNIKGASVMELGQLIVQPAGRSDYLHEEEVWGEDPVHMTPTGYKLAAEGLESVIYEKRREEREVVEKSGQGPAKKPRVDPALSRPDWVRGGVSEAVQLDGRGQIGPPPQRKNWRGNSRGRSGHTRPYDKYSYGSSHYTARGQGSDRGCGMERGRGSERGRRPFRGGRGRPW